MKIQVTDADIKKGRRWSPGGCPIALAVGRAFPDHRVLVGNTIVSLWTDNELSTEMPLPEVARDFIRSFDYAPRMQGSFEFELEVPCSSK